MNLEPRPTAPRRLHHLGQCCPAGVAPAWERRTLEALPPDGADLVALGVVMVRFDALAADEWPAFLLFLSACRRQDVPTILVHERIDATALTEAFRAGLDDAVETGADAAAWDAILERAGAHLDASFTARAIQQDAASTQRMLQDRRRRLQNEAEEETASLLTAQADLERANLQLSSHMAQLSLLYKFGRELSLASNWDDTLRDILANLAEFVGAVGGALVLRAASGGPYAPRQTYRWEEKSWDKVLLRITRQIDAGVAKSLLAPGVFQVGGKGGGGEGRITALPLEHHELRLGILLLLFDSAEERQLRSEVYLPFLQMVQVVLSEEVGAAQMLDRLRDVGTFNTRVLETVSSAIWVCEGSGRTIFVNRAARSLLGLDAGPRCQDDGVAMTVGRGRLLDRPLTGGAEIDDLPEIFLDGKLALEGQREELFATLSAHEGSCRGEGRITDIQGQPIPVHVQTAPMAGRGREDRWLLVILEDLRETKRAEAARRRAEQAEALVAMSATLAHEIRNPLMGLSAQAELLADSLPEDDRRRRRIDLIIGEVERINCTITDMLQFVRPCQPRRSVLDLVPLARDCLELARPRAEQRAVELSLVVEEPGVLDADATQIKQVLLNLVLNAVDAAPKEGSVTVRLAATESMEVTDAVSGTRRTVPGVVATVEDDGEGFGDLDPEQLFQPFFTTKTTGTGLGLAYSRKVVEAHGGEIRAERDARVTRMCVLLPREATVGKMLAGEAS